MKNKAVIIILIAISVLLGVAGAFLVINTTKNLTSEDPPASSMESASSRENGSSVIETVVSEIVSEDNEIKLGFTSPNSKTVTVTEENFLFTGTADPEEFLTVNGSEIEINSDGTFSFETTLQVGKNTFTFEHKCESVTYTVNYRYVIMNYYSPEKAQIYPSGAAVPVSVYARTGSTVTAELYGGVITLVSSPKETDTENDFIAYTGEFNLPDDNYKDLNLGEIKFTASFDGKSESFYSGNITCKKPDFIVEYDPNATPSGANYINVGSGKITEVISFQAETFVPGSTNDWSFPTYNYLPKGTVDYSAQDYVYHKDEKEYVVLRCGRQIYTSRKDVPYTEESAVIKEYAGTLPDHNEIELVSFENGSSHSKLIVNPMWKAPFYFDVLPQSYLDPANQNFKVENVTYNYIDITFCYTTVMTGRLTIPANNPLFSSGEIKKNESDYTLRLFLKNQGAFYGWNAYYNQKGQLVFEFLNPVKITAAENDYGADLTGAKVFIDVGHGGKDCGALGFNGQQTEAARNLILANKIKAELESIGATVYMNRTDDSTSSADHKIQLLKELKPDFCIAIHHNDAVTGRNNGFDSYYYHPFSVKAAEYIYMNTVNAGLYQNYGLGWHYYFMARTTACPIVLTENGYMSNRNDYNDIINDEINDKKAQALTKGIADYFLSIQNY